MMCIFGKVFCTFDIRRNSSRLEMKSKTLFFPLHFAHLFVILASPNLLSFGKAKSKKILFSFAFRSLIRNFAGKYAL